MTDFKTMRPREVEAYLRQQILRNFGDEIENKSRIIASRGYYSVQLTLGSNKYVDFQNFRKTDAPKIVRAIRALKAEGK